MFMLILLTVEIKLPALYPFIILHIILDLDLSKNMEREGGRERERKTTGCPPFLEIEWNGKFSDKTLTTSEILYEITKILRVR